MEKNEDNNNEFPSMDDQPVNKRQRGQSLEGPRVAQRMRILEGHLHIIQQNFSQFERSILTSVRGTINKEMENAIAKITCRLSQHRYESEQISDEFESSSATSNSSKDSSESSSTSGNSPSNQQVPVSNGSSCTASDSSKKLPGSSTNTISGGTSNSSCPVPNTNTSTPANSSCSQNVSKKPTSIVKNNSQRDKFSNKFESLPMEEDMAGPSSSQDSAENSENKLKKPKASKVKSVSNPVIKTQKKSAKPTPIIAYNLNQKTFKNNLLEGNKTDYRILRGKNPDRVVIFPTSKDTRDATLAVLEKGNVHHYTFTPKEEKNTTLIIKNVPNEYNADDVVDELKCLGHADKIAKISPLKTGNFAKYNFFLLQVPPGMDVGDFLKINWLFHTSVRIEKFKSKSNPQCFKCQKLGHMAKNCWMEVKCVKCAQNHATKDCTLPLNAPKDQLKCALCHGIGHPASYRGCPKHKEVTLAMKRTQTQVTKPVAKSSSNYIQENVSFAAALKHKEHQHSDTNKMNFNNINGILNSASEELFGCEYGTLKTAFDSFMERNCNSLDVSERKKALLNFILISNFNG